MQLKKLKKYKQQLLSMIHLQIRKFQLSSIPHLIGTIEHVKNSYPAFSDDSYWFLNKLT